MALDADTDLLTAHGFMALRDIREGDEVYHPTGRLMRVAVALEIVHDCTCYRVTTTDGRSAVADRDQLWKVVDKRRSRSVSIQAPGLGVAVGDHGYVSASGAVLP
jgi:hypothetical protein